MDPWIGKPLFVLGSYETEAFQFIEKLNLEGKTAIDIGANIGMFSVRLSALTTKKGIVFSFEPCPATFSILTKNILENKLENVVAEQLAVSDCDGTALFYINKANSGDSRIILMPHSLGQSYVTVKTNSLDNYFRNRNCLDDISLIKMDIQGAELLALKGMTNILQKNKNVVLYLEYEPDSLRTLSCLPVDLFNYLHKLGFHICVYDTYDECLSPISYVEQIEMLPGFKINPACNIICFRYPESLGANRIKDVNGRCVNQEEQNVNTC